MAKYLFEAHDTAKGPRASRAKGAPEGVRRSPRWWRA